MQKVVPFQIRIIEDLNREIKVDAAMNNKTKHEWIEEAIREKLERNKAV